jgi:hypothetical protein
MHKPNLEKLWRYLPLITKEIDKVLSAYQGTFGADTEFLKNRKSDQAMRP